MPIRRNDILFRTGIVTATWFALTGMAWTYAACLVIAYPAGLTSFLIWRSIRNDNQPRNKYIPRILSIGLALSLAALLLLLMAN